MSDHARVTTAGPLDEGEPDPASARTPAEFVTRLNELRTWAGKPSLRRLARLAGQTESAGGDRVDALPPSTTSYVLTGKTLPGLPRMSFVDAFVTACLTACDLAELIPGRLSRWRSAWRALATTDDEGTHRQLPMDIAEFTGREAELDRLRTMVGEAAPAVAVVAIEGMAGVGKTRFAVHAAHELTRSGRFDEIQLWADLHGFDPHQRRADPANVLEGFLRMLGVPGPRIPRDLEERAALYRDRLAGRRALVLLDNVADAEQTRPLLPGNPDCLVLITSRRGLRLDGVRRLPLDVFTPADAVALLARLAGDERIAAAPTEARRVAELCGHLPLAVALAGRRLDSRAAWTLTDLADRLESYQRHPRGQVLASLDLSYRCLSAAQQRMFRLLGLHPGTDFTAQSAAALADLTVADAEALLESLLDEYLLQQQTADRYRFHDKIRRLAVMLATDETADERHRARRRCLTWLLHTADIAVQAVEPHRRRTFDLTPHEATHPAQEFASRDDALRWCEEERANLVAAVHTAARERLDDIAWQLPAVLMRFFYLRSHWADWLDTHRIALEVTGDSRAKATILNGLGVAYGDLRQFDEAIDCCTRAARLFDEVGDAYGQAWCLNNLGVTSIDRQRPGDAVDYFDRALPLFRASKDPEGEAICLNNLGDGHRRLRRSGRAIECLQQALAVQQRAGDHTGQRYTLGTLGDLYRDTERFDEAIATYERSLAAHRAAGDRRGTGRVLHSLGLTLASVGRTDAARDRLRQAFAIFDELGDPDADTIHPDE